MQPNIDGYGGQQKQTALERLAGEIAAASSILSDYHQQQGNNKNESEQVHAGSFAIPHDAPTAVVNARCRLYEATQSMQQLLLSPTDFHLHASLDLQRIASYRWLLNFSIPDHVPVEAAASYVSVAESAQAPVDQLIRFARLAMTGGMFYEPLEGEIAHTAISSGLRKPSPVRETMLFLTETNLPTATKVVEMTLSQLNTSENGAITSERTAFQLAHDTSLPFFPYLSSHPQIAARLAAGMRTVSAASESHVSHLLNSYPWSSLPKGTTILDLGGSNGHISLAMASECPQLNFIVQDLPQVIGEATKRPMSADVQGRISFHAHSFLEPQPNEVNRVVSLCLIRQCLNNWPHLDAVRILRAIVPTLEHDNKRLLINNVVVPKPFSLRVNGAHELQSDATAYYGRGSRDEAIARVRDSTMLQLMGGAERDISQWQSLLQDADPRFEILSVTKPEGSLLSLLEVGLRSRARD